MISKRVIALALLPIRAVFGRDVFVSYTRADAAAYAAALANSLRPQYTCYLDQHAVPRGPELPLRVRLEAYTASSFVLIGTRGVVSSKWVAEEVSRFAATNRPIFIVEVDGALTPTPWDRAPWRYLQGVFRQPESNDACTAGRPSAECLKYLTESFTFTRQDRRLRWLTSGVALVVLVMLLGAGYAAWFARESVSNAQQAESRATSAETRAETANRQIADANLQIRALGLAEGEAKKDAEAQARIASSRRVAGQASAELENHPDLALLLAASAVQTAPTLEAQRSLFVALLRRPGLKRIARPLTGMQAAFALGTYTSSAVSRDGRFIVLTARDGSAFLWDLDRGELALTLRQPTANTLKFEQQASEFASAWSLLGTEFVGVQDEARATLRELVAQRLRPPTEGTGMNVDGISIAAFSADSRTFALNGPGGIAVWSRVRGRQTATIPIAALTALTFVGNQTLAASQEAAVQFWDLSTHSPRLTRTLRRSLGVTALQADAGGRFLISVEKFGRSLVSCLLPECDSPYTLLEDPNPALRVLNQGYITVDGTADDVRVAVVRADESVTVWDVSRRKELGHVTPGALGENQGDIQHILLAKGGASLFVAGGGRVREVPLTLTELPMTLRSLAKSAGIPVLQGAFVAATEEQRLPTEPALVNQPTVLPLPANGLPIAPANSFSASINQVPTTIARTSIGRLITFQTDGSLAFWDVNGRSALEKHVALPPLPLGNTPRPIVLSAGGDSFVRTNGSELFLVDLSQDTPRTFPIRLRDGQITHLAVSDDGSLIAAIVARAVAPQSQELRIWDRAGNSVASVALPTVRRDATPHVALALSSSDLDTKIAVVSEDGSTRLWRMLPAHQLTLVATAPAASKEGGPIRHAISAFSTSGRTLVTAIVHTSGSTIRVLVDGVEQALVTSAGSVAGLRVPDDQSVVAYIEGTQRMVRRWSWKERAKRLEDIAIDGFNPGWGRNPLPSGGPGGILAAAQAGPRGWPAAAMSPSGRRLAYQQDGTLFVWDLSSAQPALLFSLSLTPGATLEFDRVGDRLFALSPNGITAIDLRPSALIDAACLIAGRPLTASERARYLDERHDPLPCKW